MLVSNWTARRQTATFSWRRMPYERESYPWTDARNWFFTRAESTGQRSTHFSFKRKHSRRLVSTVLWIKKKQNHRRSKEISFSTITNGRQRGWVVIEGETWKDRVPFWPLNWSCFSIEFLNSSVNFVRLSQLLYLPPAIWDFMPIKFSWDICFVRAV